ncbi:pentatricopeptide repeat-containing protein At4g04790, mitochondrial-like isoform X2 [Typha latifolia]|uniref:pentatricopeptide repeat-containing protein At4g04790, mitochondrial-like isoform X2 n=1 Tax=Typha latifolia TaxID=4733 RepID=UPI003C2FE835
MAKSSLFEAFVSSAGKASQKHAAATAAAAAKASNNQAGGGNPTAKLATGKKTVVPPRSTSWPPRAASKPKTTAGVSSEVLSRLKQVASNSKASFRPVVDNPAGDISEVISSILHGIIDISNSSSSQVPNDRVIVNNILDKPWFSNTSLTCTSQWKKEISRQRKQKYLFKNTESRHFTKLMIMCANKLGNESTLEFFSKLGRKTGVKEYNALIKLCIEKARSNTDEEDSLDQIHKAYQLFLSMKERGFQIEEESFGPFLLYLVDMKMTQEFQMFSEFFIDENPRSYSRIGYYEMLLWIRVGNEKKIQELCNSAGVASSRDNISLAESYLLAFCESDRKKELLQLLEVVDVRKVSSLKYVASIFKSLGRFQLETFSEKFLLELKTTGTGDEKISSLIYDYAISIPNLVAEEVVSKFITLHQRLKMSPSIALYHKLITLCCNSSKVHAALDVADKMCQSGLNVSIESFQPIIHACERSCEFDMVHPIYSMMRRHNLKLNGDTFKSLISLCTKMKDFEGAYRLLIDAEEVGEMPTVIMYNAIMAGYFREKKKHRALMVLKQMEDAGVKPDSETFSYLISNCDCEEDIVKYYEKLRLAGVFSTKHVYMALINAYAKLRNFDMAKQVVLDNEVPVKHRMEIKSALIMALSSNGQLSDALNVYDEIKQAGCSPEPKAVISLIEHLQTEDELHRLHLLLKELDDSSNWFDGCSRVILYCVQHNYVDDAIDLLKQLKEKDRKSAYMVIDQMFSQIWKTDPTNIETGIELVRAIKEELDLHISRTSLDFLLSTCVKAKDSQCAKLIWAEYEAAGLPYNVLSLLRMYQALLASGECEAAKEMLKRIPKEDPHVCDIIKSCKSTYKSKAL